MSDRNSDDRNISENIGIFYFSGTGNTDYIVQQIAWQIHSRNIPVQAVQIEAVMKNNLEVNWSDYSCIGVAYPVHGFGAPAIVYDFIKARIKLNMCPVFIIAVSCDPLPINEAAVIQVRKMLSRRGGKIFLEKHIPMPANWGITYPPALSRQLFKRVKELTPSWAASIIGRKKELLKPGLFARFVSWICRAEDLGAIFYGKDYKVLKNCNLCKNCIKDCPRENISLKKGKIHFGWKCIICMRCLYYCPQQAITLRLYKFTVPEERYSARKILELPGTPDVFVTRETTGWYKHFYTYLFNDKSTGN